MISEAMKAEGWIEHDGGPCPVPLDMIVDVMFADGGTDGSIYAGFWSAEVPEMDSQWEGECDPDDRIVAYKPDGTSHDQ